MGREEGGGFTKDSALLSSRTGYFLEPTEWTKGSQASSGVWREDSGLHSTMRFLPLPSGLERAKELF